MSSSTNSPAILYTSAFSDHNLTVFSDGGYGSSEHPKENLMDLSPATFYEGIGEPQLGSEFITTIQFKTSGLYNFDSIAIVNHNLGNAFVDATLTFGTLVADTFVYDFGATFDMKPLYRRTNSALSLGNEVWQIKIEHNAPIRIGNIFIGVSLPLIGALARGARLPEFNDGIAGTTNSSQTGIVLGRSLYKRPAPYTITQRAVTDTFATGDWKDFLVKAASRPFVFSNNLYDSPLINDRNATDTAYSMATIPLTRPVALREDRYNCHLDAVAFPVLYAFSDAAL